MHGINYTHCQFWEFSFTFWVWICNVLLSLFSNFYVKLQHLLFNKISPTLQIYLFGSTFSPRICVFFFNRKPHGNRNKTLLGFAENKSVNLFKLFNDEIFVLETFLNYSHLMDFCKRVQGWKAKIKFTFELSETFSLLLRICLFHNIKNSISKHLCKILQHTTPCSIYFIQLLLQI